MQKGTIIPRGRWWLVQCRERVVIGGEIQARNVYKRLELIGPEYPVKRKDGKIVIPAAIRAKADLKLLPVNAQTTPEIVDTVETFLDGIYMPHVEATKKMSTRANYAQIARDLKSHPEFTKQPLRAITPADVQRLLAAYAAEETNRGKARSQSAIINMRAFLSGMFNYAVLNEQLATSPINKALPTPESAVEQEETYAYTLAEIRAMLDAVDNPMAKTAMLTAALTGLRKGEIAGLQFGDIQGAKLKVQRNVYKGHVDTTKTKGSKASVPLLPILAEAFEAQRARNGAQPWIFPNTEGNPMNMDQMTADVIVPAMQKAGLEWHGWHAFRRGLATNLRELGVRIEDASAILRHANTSITLDFYAKPRQEFTQAAMAKLADAFTAAKPTAAPARKRA